MQHKTFTVESKLLDAEQGIYEAMISTEDVDRDGDVLLAGGVDMGNYLKNPVVLFGHNYFSAQAVVGRALDVVAVPGRGVKARFQFAGAEVSEDADLVRRLWAGGFLNAVSVGFIPKAWKKRTTPEGEELERGYEFGDWELLEFSIVPVPANQSALRLAMKTMGATKNEQPGDEPVESAADPTGAQVDVSGDAAVNATDNLPSPTPVDIERPEEELPDEFIEQLEDLIEDLEEVLT